ALTAVHPDARERPDVARAGESVAGAGRAEVARGLHGRDHGIVVAAGRIAEEIDRDVELATQETPRLRHLRLQLRRSERRQVGVVDGVRVELPAGGDQRTDAHWGKTPGVALVSHLEIEHARPV